MICLIKKYADVFLYSVIAGVCIALGGTAYLMTENNILGAVLFTVGLFTICTMGFNLFTGKVAYLFDNKPSYIINLILIWFGNFAGTAAVAYLLKLTRIGTHLTERASALCNTKLNDSPLSMFILAIFCNLLIFIAVDSYSKNEHNLGKYLGLLFGVVAFIFCGFEHSIADMFYFSSGDAWSLKTIFYLIMVTLGNTVGGVLIPLFRLAHKKLTDNK